MPKVYAVQQPARRDRETGELRATMDLSAATEYGELVVVLPPMTLSAATNTWVPLARTKLKNFSDDDYLLPVGDMVGIAACAVIAAQMNRGKVRILSWSKSAHRYMVKTIEV